MDACSLLLSVLACVGLLTIGVAVCLAATWQCIVGHPLLRPAGSTATTPPAPTTVEPRSPDVAQLPGIRHPHGCRPTEHVALRSSDLNYLDKMAAARMRELQEAILLADSLDARLQILCDLSSSCLARSKRINDTLRTQPTGSDHVRFFVSEVDALHCRLMQLNAIATNLTTAATNIRSDIDKHLKRCAVAATDSLLNGTR